MKKRIYLIYLLPVVLFGFLFYKNLSPRLEYEYEFKKSSLASDIVPYSRVGEIGKDEFGRYAVLINEPAYLDLRMSRKYNLLRLDLAYSDLRSAPFNVCLFRDGGYDCATLEKTMVKGYRSSSAYFDISNYSSPYRKLRVVFSLPNSLETELVKLRAVRVRFEGEKYSLAEAIKKAIKNIFNF